MCSLDAARRGAGVLSHPYFALAFADGVDMPIAVHVDLDENPFGIMNGSWVRNRIVAREIDQFLGL